MNIKTSIIFFLIVVIGIVFRFYRITEVPQCLNWDEAAFGYNAFSILETGKDEYGVPYPIEFKSIGDYKFPFFIYSLVPIIKLTGLTLFSVRFLPALAGAASLIFIYAISKNVFKSTTAALISIFLLSVSPWHLQFTRAGADVGYSSFFIVLGYFGLIKIFTNTKKTSTIFSVLKYNWIGISALTFGFGLAAYTYYVDRLAIVFLTFFLGLYILLIKRDEFKKFFISFFSLGIILIPLIFYGLTTGQQSKFVKTTIFGFDRTSEYEETLLKEDGNMAVFQVIHNLWYERLFAAVDHYLNHFSPVFLFAEGPVEDIRNNIYGMGLLYATELPLILAGVFFLFKNPSYPKKFVIVWLVLAPIPSALTRDAVHARRSLTMIFPLVLLGGYGAAKLFKSLTTILTSKIARLTLISIYITLHFYLIGFFVISYLFITPMGNYKGPAGWQCGYKEAVEVTQKYKGNYDTIVIDTLYQGSYLFYLFFEKYPPANYQPQASLSIDEGRLGEGEGYDNYIFRPIYWPEDRKQQKTLFIGPPEKLPLKDIIEGEAELIDEVKFPNDEPAFYFIETK